MDDLRDRYELLFQNLTSAFALHRMLYSEEGKPKDYEFLEVNPAFENLTGISSDSLIGKTVLQVMPQTESYWIETFGKVADQGIVHHYENYSQSLNRYYRCVAFSHRKGFFAVVFDDVTEHRRQEVELRRRESLFNAIFQNRNGLAGVLDPQGHLLQVNNLALDFIGVVLPEVEGKLFWETPWWNHSMHLQALLKDAIHGACQGIPHRFEVNHYNRRGEKRNVDFRLTPIADNEGQVIHILAEGTDVTEYKAEVAYRDGLLKEVARKNGELETLLYAMSHDLRSPLVNLYGYSAELAQNLKDLRAATDSKERERLFDEDVAESLGYIKASVQRLDRLQSGILRISRLGRAALEITTIQMDVLLDELLQTMQHQISELAASIHHKDLLPCKGDANQVMQVVTNLIDNSLKYRRPEVPPVVSVSSKIVDGQVEYCFEDNGRGIPAAFRDKVFEVFHRLDPSGVAEGEGLGLTISKRILDRLDGSIVVESNPNGPGVRFLVKLPAP